MNILLVWPAAPTTFWSYEFAIPFISKKAAYPPLGLLTVAAMLPDEWRCRVLDLQIRGLTDTDIAWADYVLISGMIVHAESAHQVAQRCKRAGKTVIAGGPLFTTGHENFPEIDHFVLGEAEDIMPELVEDMISGHVKHTYSGAAKPDVTGTPVPRWDLINMKDYATMAVQFSRGCPFNCEFCDIIVMYGRAPRTKTTAQMLSEFDALLDAGWKGDVFIVDDNFIGHPRNAKELLRELVVWRKRRGVRAPIIVEASLNILEIPGLLELMIDAGVRQVFLGIETPQLESLLECKKVQNTRRDMMTDIRTLQEAGIEVMGGFIIGFDNDTSDIFKRQWRFIQDAGITTAMVGLLTALPQTPLYTRLKDEGRLLLETTGNNLDAILNFMPELDRDWMINSYRSFMKRLYSTEAYYRRALTFLRHYRPKRTQNGIHFRELMAFFKSAWIMGVRHRGRRQYWKYLATALLRYPRAFPEAVRLAIVGFHFRRVAANI